MAGSDWNNLGRDIKDIVQNAIDTGDFGALNRDLGVTIENALGNVAQSLKAAGKTAMGSHRENENKNNPDDNNAGQYQGYHYDYNYKYNNGGHYTPYEGYRRTSLSRSAKAAREEFALFVNTRGTKALGVVFTAVGIGFAGIFGFVAGILGLVNLFEPAPELFYTAIAFGIVALISAGMGICGNNFRKRIKRFRAYVKTLNGKHYASIRELAKSVRKSEKFVLKDLNKMIEKRMFLEGHLDRKGTCLIVSDEAYEQYMETEKHVQEMQEKEAEAPENQLSEEVRRVIEAGNRYIEEVRRSNDAIPGIEVSNKMYHLENVLQRIFKRVEQHPELINDLHKFMDYYLPTTMKLLNAYEELDRQDMEGENIRSAKLEIENTLDTINIAFENLLDSFYKETAWDVSSDISVLKTMFAQEGLTGKQDFQGKE